MIFGLHWFNPMLGVHLVLEIVDVCLEPCQFGHILDENSCNICDCSTFQMVSIEVTLEFLICEIFLCCTLCLPLMILSSIQCFQIYILVYNHCCCCPTFQCIPSCQVHSPCSVVLINVIIK